MKKIILLLLICGLLCLAGCGECEHQWSEATCETPKTCTLCGATEGEALGHSWTDADCEHAKTCTVCEKTEGDPLGHAWQAATCTEAKLCTVCEAVEGEPLGHDLQPANYQDPATCSVCGYTEGECLEPKFAQYPVSVIQTEMGVEYDYETACYIAGYTTVGKLWWEDYRVFASDETHEAVEGYEWHTVTVHIRFEDRNAYKFGFIVQPALDDYYWYEAETENGYTDVFTVSYYGVLYDQCLRANSQGSYSEWVDNTCTFTATYAWRVPVGYDGHLVLFYNAAKDAGDLLESGDETILVFRFE